MNTLKNFDETPDEKEVISSKIEKTLNKKVHKIFLKGSGMCNNAYYVETEDGQKYLVKKERFDKTAEENNDLEVEGSIIQKLNTIDPSLPIPQVIFISTNPKMYGYKYIEGEMLINIWSSLNENQKIEIFRSLGEFHAKIIPYITEEEAKKSRLQVSLGINLHPEIEAEFNNFISDKQIPENIKNFALKLKEVFNSTNEYAKFHFIQADTHHENIIIKDGKISGIIDFGDTEYGDVYNEFCRYIQDYPDYFEYAVKTYEITSGNILSRKRLISYAGLCKLSDMQKSYRNRENINDLIKSYENLLKNAEF